MNPRLIILAALVAALFASCGTTDPAELVAEAKNASSEENRTGDAKAGSSELDVEPQIGVASAVGDVDQVSNSFDVKRENSNAAQAPAKMQGFGISPVGEIAEAMASDPLLLNIAARMDALSADLAAATDPASRDALSAALAAERAAFASRQATLLESYGSAGLVNLAGLTNLIVVNTNHTHAGVDPKPLPPEYAEAAADAAKALGNLAGNQ